MNDWTTGEWFFRGLSVWAVSLYLVGGMCVSVAGIIVAASELTSCFLAVWSLIAGAAAIVQIATIVGLFVVANDGDAVKRWLCAFGPLSVMLTVFSFVWMFVGVAVLVNADGVPSALLSVSVCQCVLCGLQLFALLFVIVPALPEE